MRRVASRAAFDFERRVFKDKRTLFIGVAFDARRIRADRQIGLLGFKTAVGVMTIAALHRAFHNFVAERLAELRLHFRVTAYTKLRLAHFQHRGRSDVRFLSGRIIYQRDRIRF